MKSGHFKTKENRRAVGTRNQNSSSAVKCPQCGNKMNGSSRTESVVSYCAECGCVPSASTKGLVARDQGRDVDGCHQRLKNMRMQGKLNFPDMNTSLEKSWLAHARPMDQSEMNIATALGEITRITMALSLQLKVAEKAADVCRRALELPIRGHALTAIAATSVYAAARQCSIGVTLNELTSHSKIRSAELSHCFKTLQRQLRLSIPLPSLEQHATRILELIRMETDGIKTITEIVHEQIAKVQNIGAIQGKHPGAVAGAIVYLIAVENGHNITQREIARTIGVTETTIRNCCRLLRSENNLAFSPVTSSK